MKPMKAFVRQSRIDRRAILSMGRELAPDLSSGESGLTEGEEL